MAEIDAIKQRLRKAAWLVGPGRSNLAVEDIIVSRTSDALTALDEAFAAGEAARAVSDEAVEALRASLWASWGANRRTTDWPTRGQLRDALAAALRDEGGPGRTTRGLL